MKHKLFDASVVFGVFGCRKVKGTEGTPCDCCAVLLLIAVAVTMHHTYYLGSTSPRPIHLLAARKSTTVPASNHTNTEKTCRTNKPHGKCSSPLAIRLSFSLFSLFLAPFTSHLFCQYTNIQRHTHFHVVMHYAMCFQWCFALLPHLFAFFLSALRISVFREEKLCSLVFWQACHGFCFLFTVRHFGHCCLLLVVLPFLARFSYSTQGRSHWTPFPALIR